MAQQCDNPRRIALEVLYQVKKQGAYANMALKEALGRASLKPQDRALTTSLVYGCVKYRLHLDYVIGRYSTVKLKKLSDYVHIILWIGVYQLAFLDRIPASAAVNESVKLAKRYAARSAGLINAVLRKVGEDYQNLTWPQDETEYLSTYYSYPKELVALYLEQFGRENCEKLLIAGNTPGKVTVSVNPLKTTADKLLKILEQEGVKTEKSQLENSLTIDTGDLASLKSYKQGYFIPQGIPSAIAVRVLAPEKGMLAMDLCAAPGGKTAGIAGLMDNRGRILAFDVHPHKIDLIEQNAARLGADIIEAVCYDSTKYLAQYRGKADRVLVDAPCSGLGIVAKKPDLRYGFTKEGAAALTQVQYQLLCVGASYLKEGGRLVYSTCTLNRAENEGVVNRFLKEHPDFRTADITEFLAPFGKDGKDGYTTFYPHTDHMDGFFICALARRQN